MSTFKIYQWEFTMIFNFSTKNAYIFSQSETRNYCLQETLQPYQMLTVISASIVIGVVGGMITSEHSWLCIVREQKVTKSCGFPNNSSFTRNTSSDSSMHLLNSLKHNAFWMNTPPAIRPGGKLFYSSIVLYFPLNRSYMFLFKTVLGILCSSLLLWVKFPL